MVAAASRNAALLALVVIVILLADQGHVVADIDRYLVSTDLYPKQSHILSRFESQGIPGNNDGLGIAPLLPRFLPLTIWGLANTLKSAPS